MAQAMLVMIGTSAMLENFVMLMTMKPRKTFEMPMVLRIAQHCSK